MTRALSRFFGSVNSGGGIGIPRVFRGGFLRRVRAGHDARSNGGSMRECSLFRQCGRITGVGKGFDLEPRFDGGEVPQARRPEGEPAAVALDDAAADRQAQP